jgi:hypothetical protein
MDAACPHDGGGNETGETGPDVLPDGSDASETSVPVAMSLAIDPSSASLMVQGGSTATQAFHASAHFSDGTDQPVLDATWTLDDTSIGTIDANGVFTANGRRAGVVQVRAEAIRDGVHLMATAALTVRAHFEILGSLPSDTSMHFTSDAMMDARSPRVLYPLDGAVMPGNVPAPDVQWDQGTSLGQMDDVYRVRVERPSVVIDGFVRNTGPEFTFDWLVDSLAWEALVSADAGTNVRITVDRWDSVANQHVGGTPVTMTLTRGQIHGAIYYSELVRGPGPGVALPRVTRVTVDAARHEFVVPYPPADGVRVETQTLTRDGRYLAGEMASQVGAEFDVLTDLTSDPAPSVYPITDTSPHFHIATFRPDGTRLLFEALDDLGFSTGLGMLDPVNGASIAATGLPVTDANGHFPANPAYAPEGTRVALVTGAGNADDWTGLGDLATMAQTGADAFAAPSVIHHGADLASAPESGNADSHPSWSPDGRWIAFQHSAVNPVLVETSAPSAIYLIAPEGGATTRLDRALGGATGTDSYWPAFAPFRTAEEAGASYYWVVFTSTRDYGNEYAGTRGTGTPQLWVAAIRAPVTAGTDPSFTPYWLPGQSTGTPNLAATWAPTACLATGTTCTALSQCCTGNCATDSAHPGSMTCQAAGACRQRAQTCSASSDCCSGLTCTNNVCELAPPG